MLPIEELLWVMNHTEIESIVKTPFVKFMHQVYLQFAGDIIESAAADLQHNKWVFVNLLSSNITLNWYSVISMPSLTPLYSFVRSLYNGFEGPGGSIC